LAKLLGGPAKRRLDGLLLLGSPSRNRAGANRARPTTKYAVLLEHFVGKLENA
jgi:hypothetical protein